MEEANGGGHSDVEEGDEEKKEELTENEKQIDRLKLEAEKVQEVLAKMKQAKGEQGEDGVKQEDVNMDNVMVKMEDIKTEEVFEGDVRRTERAEGEGAPDTLVDVESDSAMANLQASQHQAVQPPTSLTADGKPVIPTITVEPAPSNEDEEGEMGPNHPKGTSRTIFHEDHVNSLNELFAPAVSYQQYSPTLTSLNPQKINESLTDALSKQSTTPTMSGGMITAQAKIDSSATSIIETLKEPLTAKPSIELNRNESVTTAGNPLDLTRHPIDILKVNDFSRDYVPNSDDERSISPENALTECHKTYPQDERDVKGGLKSQIFPTMLNPASMNHSMSTYMQPLLQNLLEQSMMSGQHQRTFEKAIMFQDLGKNVVSLSNTMNVFQSKMSTTMPNIPTKLLSGDPSPVGADQMSLSSAGLNSSVTTDAKTMMPFDATGMKQPSLLEQRLLASHARPPKAGETPAGGASTTTSSIFPTSTPFDGVSSSRGDYPVKPSLLEQRLLAETIKSDVLATVSSAAKMFMQQSSTFSTTTSGSKLLDETNKISGGEGVDKRPATSPLTVSRDPAMGGDKQKPPGATSLRINPPTSGEEQQRAMGTTWFPEVVNETNTSLQGPEYYNPSVTSSFRIPVPKTTYPSYSMPSSISSITGPKDPKNLALGGKPRAMLQQPVPIAPAPNPGMQGPRGEFIAPPLDYASPNGGT